MSLAWLAISVAEESVETIHRETPAQVWGYATKELSGTKKSLDDLTDSSATDIWTHVTRAITDKDGFKISGVKVTLDDLTDIAAVDVWSGIITPSDTQLLASDAEVSTPNSTYTKVKEFRVTMMGEYRIKFDLKHSTGGGTAYGRIYLNGVVHGTEQSTSSSTYVTKSEDLGEIDVGDLIQLYIKTSNFQVLAQNYRLYGDVAIGAGIEYSV